MTFGNLENLVRIHKLKKESASQEEFNGLVESGRVRLVDAAKSDLSLESRFDLVYNASHALSLAALRWHGYRPEDRYLVFQCLEETLGIAPEYWKVLAKGHDRRNLAEYQGHLDVEERLVEDMIVVAGMVLDKVSALGKRVA